MFELLFFKDNRGKSDIIEYLDELKDKALVSKDAAINRRKILAYMAALQEKGTLLGEPYVRHIEEDIWELRPLQNRILFFYWGKNRFVMLHSFIKKTRKTPKREVDRAKRERDAWKEGNPNEND